MTFLFSDVEGSTRLVKRLRDRYGPVLSEHQSLLRDAFAAHGGHEVDTQGDAFFLFSAVPMTQPSPRRTHSACSLRTRGPTVSSCACGWECTRASPWCPRRGGYHGIGVHRAARIMAAGTAGQVLASQATASVLFDDEPDGLALRDLGEHELKDFDRPERIYQLEVDGLSAEFPPIKASPSRESFELVAASLRADTRDLSVFVEVLAQKLESSVPDATHVERGGFRGSGRVKRIELELGEHRYRIEEQARHPSRAHVVRGITLKNDELVLDEWIDSLSRDLAEEAEQSERGRLALDRLLHE